MELTVTSPAFDNEGMIPSKYTCEGENVSPGISWKNVPEGTGSLIVIMEDRDIPMTWLRIFTWIHWIVYNIPPDMKSIPEAITVGEALENGAQQGMTSYRKMGYGGPAPVSGTHRYYFKVYAIDKMLTLEPEKATKKRILKEIKGHTLAEGIIMGKYSRRRRL